MIKKLNSNKNWKEIKNRMKAISKVGLNKIKTKTIKSRNKMKKIQRDKKYN